MPVTAANRLNRQSMLQELDALTREQGNYDDLADRLNSDPMQATKAPRSGYMGRNDYIRGLNRQGDIADLTSKLSGKGGVTVRASYPGGSGRPGMSALASAIGPDDNYDQNAFNGAEDTLGREARLEQLKRVRLGNEQLEDAAATQDKLHDPYYREQWGNVERAEMGRDATATGAAASNRYAAEEPIRRGQQWDAREQARDRGFYDPTVERARLEASGRVASAQADQQKEKSAAMKALTDLVKAQSSIQPELTEEDPHSGFDPFGGMFGDQRMGKSSRTRQNPQWQALQSAIDDSRRVLGLSGEQTPGVEGGEALSMQDLQEVATQRGWTIEQAAAEARKRGYAIRQ